ncbi:MAG: sodium:proton antiporter [Phycisphaerales bacterium]|nr:MAG: sodium:proton antiporter [Phycisphaerales bacterium]
MSDTIHQAERKRTGPVGWIAILLGAAAMGFLIYYNIVHLHAPPHVPTEAPAAWGIGVLPFVALLGCIAVLPLLPATHHWWENNVNRLLIALICALGTLVYYLIVDGPEKLLPVLNHAVPAEYVPFIVLLFSLYVISGGICLKGDLAAHPITNTGFIAFGAIIASFVGTTGASMLLIRPLLQTNHERKHVVHTVVFFIFLVSNIGGCLLPIGDPPLFLGYLRGVAFFWTFNLWVEWAFCCAILLILYFAIDTYFYKKEALFDLQKDETHKQPLRLIGSVNILWLAGIVACVATVNHESTLIHAELTEQTAIQELNGSRGASLGEIAITNSAGGHATIDLAGAATIGAVCQRINADDHLQVTASIEDNRLLLTDNAGGPGALAVAYPEHHEDEHAASEAPPDEGHGGHATTIKDLGLNASVAEGRLLGNKINPGWTPFPFLREVLMFVLVGLSLITTPKGAREANEFNYAAILEVAALFIGIFIAMQAPIEVLKVYGDQLGLTQPAHFFWATGSLSSFLDNAPTYVVFFETAGSLAPPPGADLSATVISEPLLIGISLGAVFMGAMTYIGNGPNFMVKAIAEQSGVKMPSFFGYMVKYSIPCLIPAFVLVTLVFLTGGDHGAGEAAADHPTPAAQVEYIAPQEHETPADEH